MSLPTYYSVGSASIASGGHNVVTFSGALLGTADNPTIQAGDLFCDPAQPLVPPQRIASVDYDAGTAALAVNWPGTTMAAAAYEVRYVGDTVRSTAQTREVLTELSTVEANGRGLFYVFDDSTTDSDPGAGKLRINAATFAASTGGYIDNLDANGATVSSILDTWDDTGEATGRGQLWVRSIAAPSVFAALDVTGSVVDGTGYRKLAWTYVGGSGSLAAGDEVMVMFVPVGAKGADGQIVGLLPQGRLSLTSGVSITTADVNGAIFIYYVPCAGGYVPVFDGTSFVARPIGAQLILELDGDSGHSGYQQSGKNFDLFVYWDGSSLQLGTGPTWNSGAVAGSNSARGTGAGSTELELVAGFWVNRNSITLRIGANAGDTVTIAAQQATAVGSFRATSDGEATDSAAKRLLFNFYNQAPRSLRVSDATATWIYSTNALRQAHGNAANQVEILCGLGGVHVDLQALSEASSSTSTQQVVSSGIGLDDTTSLAAGSLAHSAFVSSSQVGPLFASFSGSPGIGWHAFAWLECGAGSDTQQWFGSDGSTYRTGLSGTTLL